MKKTVHSSYTAQRVKNLYSPIDDKPYKLSRSKIENFMRCQRCFYLDRRCGTNQPPMFAYTLNNAVDTLLKDEFDQYRTEKKAHPYLLKHGIDAIPFSHPALDDWRKNQRGIKYHHAATNFIITGAIDDVWINSSGELIIVDYKATSTEEDVTLDDRDSYKRQMEIYQWLFRKNGFNVSETGYFVSCNGDASRGKFTNTLLFKVSLLPYAGNDSWIEETLYQIKDCLTGNTIPNPTPSCDYCEYLSAIKGHTDKDKLNRMRSN